MSATLDLLRALARAEPPRDAWRLLAEQWPGGVLFYEPHGTLAWSNAAAGRMQRLPAPLLFAGSPAAFGGLAGRASGDRDAHPGHRVRSWLPMGVARLARLSMVPLAGDVDGRIACLLDWAEAGDVASAAEERLEAALDIARGGVWEMVFATGAVTYSDSYYRMLGVDVADGRAMPDFWVTHVHPGDVDAVRAAFNDYATGRSQTFEYEYRMRHSTVVGCGCSTAAAPRRATSTGCRCASSASSWTSTRGARPSRRCAESEERFRLATGAVNGVIYESDLISGRHAAARHRATHRRVRPGSAAGHRREVARAHPRAKTASACAARSCSSARAPRATTISTTARRPHRRPRHPRGRAAATSSTRAAAPCAPSGSSRTSPIAWRPTRRYGAASWCCRPSPPASATNLALYDREHRCLFANYTLHGAPVNEIVGKRIYDYIPETYHAQVRAAFDAVIATGRGADTESEMQLEGEPTPRIFETRLRPVQSGGQIVGLVTNISDVTELRSQRENLQPAAASSRGDPRGRRAARPIRPRAARQSRHACAVRLSARRSARSRFSRAGRAAGRLVRSTASPRAAVIWMRVRRHRPSSKVVVRTAIRWSPPASSRRSTSAASGASSPCSATSPSASASSAKCCRWYASSSASALTCTMAWPAAHRHRVAAKGLVPRLTARGPRSCAATSNRSSRSSTMPSAPTRSLARGLLARARRVTMDICRSRWPALGTQIFESTRR